MRRLIALALICAPPAAYAQERIETEADGSRTLVNEAVVPASPDSVWQAVTTAEGWKRWGVPAAWFVPGDSDLLETAYDPAAKPGDQGNIQQRFVARLPRRLLVFRTVKTPTGFPHAQAFMGVTQFMELSPEAGGTRVRLTGVNYPAGEEGDALLAFFKTGNRETLDQMAERLALAPLDFLVGHCWRGNAPGEGIDTHCFKAEAGHVRDHHAVVVKGKTVYSGDTVYSWDKTAGAVRYVYTAESGRMEGLVRPMEGGLDFGVSSFVPAGGRPSLAIRTKWTWIGDRAYDALDEIVAKSSPDWPRRYTRVD